MQQCFKMALAAAAILPFPATLARAEDGSPQRVEITGSRIPVDFETAQPIQVLTQDQIQKSGLVTVGDIVANLTSAGAPAFSRGAILTPQREAGGQYANMRNLGAQRLLVLVNGKRWTQTLSGYTDMSTVPAAMIERIEVLKDGASSIYGSDAIAGVINIILKKTLQGGRASLYGGRNGLGDGKTRDYSLAYGAGDDQAALMFGLTRSEQDAVWARDRAATATSFGPGHLNSGFGTGQWGHITQVGPNGKPAGFNYYLNHTGSYNGGGTGSDSRDPASYHPYAGADADNYNPTHDMMFTPYTGLTSIFARGSIALPMDMRLSTTAMFAQRDTVRQVSGYPLNSLAQSKFPVYIDKDSYYNPYGNQVAGAGRGQDLFFFRRPIELPRGADSQTRTLHIDTALEGTFALAGEPWKWGIGYTHSATSGNIRTTGNFNLLNLKKALGPSFRNAAGVVQCGTAAAPVALAECVPWDILGGPSVASQAAIDYTASSGYANYGSTVGSATADLAGELFALPAGPLAVAGGLEHRRIRGYDLPGQFEQSGFSSEPSSNPTVAHNTVREAYLELNVPLLKNAPLAQLLSVNLASRYSDYSNFGNTTNSKASAMWKPARDLLVRATWAQGFRAPTVGDTFGGGAQGFDNYLDACDSVNGEAAINPAVRQRCASLGVPAGFRQVNQVGIPVGSGGGQTPYPFEVGAGNASLVPETAVTRTAGLVYSPSWLPGLSAALDYFDISVKNRITALTATYEINECYVHAVQSFCDKITRDPVTGMITMLSRSNANLGELKTKGFDLTATYRFRRTAFGQFAVRSDSTYVDTYRVKNSADGEWLEYAGEYGYNRVKSNLALDWSLGSWSATFATRYYSPVKTHCWSTALECSNPGEKANWGTNWNREAAEFYSDLSVAWSTPWKGTILVGANNVFDKKPKVLYDASSNFGGASSSSSVNPDLPIDRFIYLRYSQSF